MVIYDITKELFATSVYPGDPVPVKTDWMSMEKGNICNLTSLNIGSHSGTHIDAPKHFIATGKDIAEVSLEKCIGDCLVVNCNERIISDLLIEISKTGINKILLRGNASIDEETAKNIVKYGISLIGVETPTIGAGDYQVGVHRILLENEIVILENLQLGHIKEGRYFLAAQPLKMQGVDGSPVRAVLIEDK